mgnify:CR=1 FL=1
MLEGILFDYDGTISSSSKRQFEWFKYWAEHNNVDFPFSQVDEFMIYYNYHINKEGGVQNVYDELDLPCDMDDFDHLVWQHYKEFKQKNSAGIYSGMEQALRTIREMTSLSEDVERNRRVLMAINTTNSWESIHKELSENELIQCFDYKVTKETLLAYHGAGKGKSLEKPSKISVALSLQQMGTNGVATIHIGDSLVDLQSSINVRKFGDYRNESLITVGVLWGYEGEKILQGVKTDYGRVNFRHIAEKPEDLPRIISTYL